MDDGTPYYDYPDPPSQEELERQYVNAIQDRLDTFAQSRGYDNIHTASSYRDDEDSQFALEGSYCCKMRSRTWKKCYEILTEVTAGERPVPLLDELMDELPVLEWPE
jgi:hypothetical protein